MNTLNKHHWAVFMLSAVMWAEPVNALEVTLEEGLDSNPFELSDPTETARYTKLQVQHKGSRDLENKQTLQYSAGLQSQVYEREAGDADNHRMDARVRWINRFKIGERRASLLVTGDVRADRRTYYSQIQRQVAETSQGDSLAERFDYNSGRVSAELIYRLEGQKSISLYSYLDQRDYVEDYQSIGLESLDYQEFSLQPTFRYKSKNGLYLRAFVYWRDRVYDQLLNDGEDGRNIEGSTLVYQFTGYGLLVRKQVTPNLSVKAYLNGYEARDDAQGYRDLDFQKLQLGVNYQLAEEKILSATGHCFTRDYFMDSARPPESETGSSGRLRDGCYLEARYRAPLWNLADNTLYWQLLASRQYERNSDDYLDFDKSTLSLGLHYGF